MRRLSPITIGLTALMLAILGATAFLVVRSHRPPPDHVADSEPVAPPVAPPSVAVRPPDLTAVPPPAPAELPPVAAVQLPPVDDAGSLDDDDAAAPAAARGRRGLLIVNHNRRRQEADENVFNTLGLSDATRTAIRQINEDYRRRTEPAPDRAPTDVAESSAALAARTDAIARLLGSDAAKTFESEERAAVLRLRGKYRFEWGRQLRQ
jgi:hypothetical protein